MPQIARSNLSARRCMSHVAAVWRKVWRTTLLLASGKTALTSLAKAFFGSAARPWYSHVFKPSRKIAKVLPKGYVAVGLGYRSEIGGIGNERFKLFPDVVGNNNFRF
jgi:hypothetical protein